MGQIVAQPRRIGLDHLIRQDAQAGAPRLDRQGRQDGLLEHGQAFDGLGQEPVRPRRQGGIGQVGIAGYAQQHRHPGFGRGDLADQVGAIAVGKAQIDDHHRRAIGLQVPRGRTQAIGPPDPGA